MTDLLSTFSDGFPEVSIVIPTYFVGKVLRHVLISVSMLDYPKDRIDVIVVAVPSDEEAYFHVKRVQNEYKLKINFTTIDAPNVDVQRNYGVRLCKHEYVFLVDDDVILHRNVLKRAIQIILSKEKIAAVGYPVMSDNPSLIEKLHYGRYTSITTSTYTVMPCSLFRRSILLKLDLYREDMGPPNTIHEDWELGTRIRKNGYDVILDGGLIMKHVKKTRQKQNLILHKNENEKDVRKSSKIVYLLRMVVNYARQYISKNWWSMLQVLKSNSPIQLLEYLTYVMVPPILLTFLILELKLFVLSLTVILSSVILSNLVKGHYRAFDICHRMVYSLILFVIRVLRSYLFILGFLIARALSREKPTIPHARMPHNSGIA